MVKKGQEEGSVENDLPISEISKGNTTSPQIIYVISEEAQKQSLPNMNLGFIRPLIKVV